jgi:hypothetical protein
MTKPRVTATDRLADVIEVVELGRRTGLLMVERGSGEMLEEGAIYFQSGRAIYAAVERVRGQDALSVLGGWGACRFSFDPGAAPPAPNIAPQQPARATPTSQDSWSGSAPGYYSQPSQAIRRSHASPPSWYAPPSQPPAPGSMPQSQPPSQPTGPFSASWPDPRSGSMPGVTGVNGGFSGSNGGQGNTPTSGSLGPLPLPYGWSQPGAPITGPTTPTSLQPTAPHAPISTQGMTGMPAPQRPATRADAALLRRPRRAPSAQNLMAIVQRYGLSRAHRTLLMLADGEHNVIDIARLSSKQIEEVQALLSELESHGLVYYY